MNHTPRKYVFKYLNLGCEMIFILEQRLRDSNIDLEKKSRVLAEVLERFLSDEEVYKINDTLFKQQFSRIAHSSIMKLNENSMNKLYDLMTMALKYQVFHCINPSQMYLLLLNHFESLEDIYKFDQALRLRIRNHFQTLVSPRFCDLTLLKWARLRREILNDYQDLHIRVSLLLRKQLQLDDSRFILKKTVPAGFKPPGKTIMCESNREISWKVAENAEAQMESETTEATKYRGRRHFSLGENVYDASKTAAYKAKAGVYTDERNAISEMLGFESETSTALDLDVKFTVLEDDEVAKDHSAAIHDKAAVNSVTCEKAQNREIEKLISSLQETASDHKEEPNDLLALMDSLNA